MSIIQRRTAPRQSTFAPSPHEVYDVTGAGDTAVAAMALGAGQRGATARAPRASATLAAGIVVGKHGTATATRGEILARLEAARAASGTRASSFTLERVQQLVLARWRELGLRIAFTNGCFDCCTRDTCRC